MRISLFLLSCALLCWAACSSPKKPAGAPAESTIEPHRPHFHFTPPANWMNDPNDMVWHDGEYHLFYQYYPDSTVWGPMHWGHAVSRDMLNWQHLPLALYPDSLGLIFSGSAVVDEQNTSGLGSAGIAPMVAIFTHHDMEGEKTGKASWEYQSLAYSLDKGRSWIKYPQNPVINNPGLRDFRDPKVLWDSARSQWVMVLAAGDHSQFWVSKNLKEWTHTGSFGQEWGGHGGVWECPDLFPLRVAGSYESRWVLLQSINPGGPNGGSATQYFIGDFDGKRFVPDPAFMKELAPARSGRALWVDHGRDNYAGVTWSGIPAADGRRLFLGWMSNWDYAQVVPTERWRSAMTLPRSLSLQRTPKGLRLFSQPVTELETLRGKSLDFGDAPLSPGERILAGFPANRSELILEIEPSAKAAFYVELRNARGEKYRIGYDAVQQLFISDRRKAGKTHFSDAFAQQVHTAPRSANGKTVRLHLFFDRGSAELFADGGETVMTELFFPNEDFSEIYFVAEGGNVQSREAMAYELKPASFQSQPKAKP